MMMIKLSAILLISCILCFAGCGGDNKGPLKGDENEARKLCEPYGIAYYDHGQLGDDYTLKCKSK